MLRVAKFYKVSFEMFKKGMLDFSQFTEEDLKEMYDKIVMPARATIASAGYDFHAPFAFTLKPGETIKIPTGIRCRINEDYALFVFPRSGLGFKYRLQLNNTVGIIDSDYFGAENEGHIFIKLTNDSNEGKVLSVESGDSFAQGIFMQYGITEDDYVTGKRIGGMGSTSEKK